MDLVKPEAEGQDFDGESSSEEDFGKLQEQIEECIADFKTRQELEAKRKIE
jgi:hypothetical protein